jgi:glycosyltransferase involved in cell wall biosynthesis
MTTLTPEDPKHSAAPPKPAAVPHIPVASRSPARSLRVLMISHTCQSPVEGQPKVRELLKYDDLDLRVIVPHRWKHYGAWREPKIDADLEENVRAERVRFPWVGPAQCYLHRYPDLPAILAAFRPHVIDLWEEPWGAVSAHAIRVNQLMSSPAKVISETEQNIEKKLPWPFEGWRAFTLKHADHLVGRSSEAVEVAHLKGYSGLSTVVPNGVDVETFTPLPDREALRAERSLSGFVVGYVGRFVEEKGVLDFVDALASCDTSVNAVFIGSGPLAEAIASRASEKGVAGRVRLVPQLGDPAELAKWMNAIDVLALPSRTTARWKEQFGRVLAEAGACGRPVIGTNSGAIPDVIGDAGIVVPEREPAALATAIESLRVSPARVELLGQLGRRRAVDRYSWAAVARAMHGIYASLAPDAANARGQARDVRRGEAARA